MTIAIAYHFFPHYRAGVFEELARSDRCNYLFIGSPSSTDPSIKTWTPPDSLCVKWTRTYRLPFGLWWQTGLLISLYRSDIKAAVILGDPNYVSNWVALLLLRVLRKPVYLWTHGWLKNNAGLRGKLKDLFYSLADGLLLYGHRAERIAIARGYPPSKIKVIYNSLRIGADTPPMRSLSGSGVVDESPSLICTARLTAQCRFDLLLKAASLLNEEGCSVRVVLVGDGPVRRELEELSNDLGVHAIFYGACYDETVLGELIAGADVLVSPGKIGLSAIHSLAYGTPAITHSDFDAQGPEFEAIVPGLTGDFFKRGDVRDLAMRIKAWINRPDRQEIRRACLEVVSQKYNPRVQRQLIEDFIVSRISRP